MKTLWQLIDGLEIQASRGELDIPVSGVCYDSRKAGAGSLFVCIRGTRVDGHAFIADAVSRGAVAIVAETEPPEGLAAAFVRVRDSRRTLAAISACFYDYPASRLVLIGITGTNGKTTTSLLIESILRCAGHSPGVLGTLAYRWAGNEIAAPMTTPESLDLHAIFHRMLLDGVSHVVMEVSSHALALDRVAGCIFRAGVFTNLSQDHLDFHLSMEDYFAAKMRLFSTYLDPKLSAAAINEDDEYGRRIIGNGARGTSMVGYSAEVPPTIPPAPPLEKGGGYGSRLEKGGECGSPLEKGSGNGPPARKSVFATDVRFSPEGIRAGISTPAGRIEIESALVGRLNLYNILAAVAAAVSIGIEPDAIGRGIRAVSQVDGRLERVAVPGGYGFEVIVDYAHTPDAMEKALGCLREMAPKRLLAVFGCGGDRDRGKRPIMGRVAAEQADLVIITSDNPRTEVPDTILDEIEAGVKESGIARFDPHGPSPSGKFYVRETDRRKAIEIALSLARPGDILFIGGKGHETYQIIGTAKHSFDDRLVVKEFFQKSKIPPRIKSGASSTPL